MCGDDGTPTSAVGAKQGRVRLNHNAVGVLACPPHWTKGVRAGVVARCYKPLPGHRHRATERAEAAVESIQTLCHPSVPRDLTVERQPFHNPSIPSG